MTVSSDLPWEATAPESSTANPVNAPRTGAALRRVPWRDERGTLERVGRYTILTQIAGGGMGSVLLGLMRGPAEFSRLVAIKCLHTRWLDDPKYVARFTTEVKLAARIRHPNVVQTLDVVEQAGELFLVMEYVDGVTLGALLGDLNRFNRSLPIGVAAGILGSVLRGLHAAHEAVDETGRRLDIVHRDVSPQNIMIARSGFVQVLDFGAAKAVEHAQHTAAGSFVGKLAYMAPEQLLGEGSSPRTDVFAAGVVLWEALTGQRLFYDPSLARSELLHALVLKPIRSPSELRADIPTALDEVVSRALERDPERRFQSAWAFAEALEGAVGAATGSALAELVAEVCAPRLAERAEQLRSGLAEAASNPSRARAGEPLARPAPQMLSSLVATRVVQGSSRSRLAWFALAVLTALGVGWLTVSLRAPHGAPAVVPVAAPGAATPRRELALEEQGGDRRARVTLQGPAHEVAMAADAPENAAGVAPASLAASARPDKVKQPAARRAERRSKVSLCDPPTYVDSEGIRHFKRHCL